MESCGAELQTFINAAFYCYCDESQLHYMLEPAGVDLPNVVSLCSRSQGYIKTVRTQLFCVQQHFPQSRVLLREPWKRVSLLEKTTWQSSVAVHLHSEKREGS